MPTVTPDSRSKSYIKHSHCSYCGQPFQADANWPRTCSHCHNASYLNPLPVAVLLLPIETEKGIGVLMVRRTIEPRKGLLALPGGFMELGESWQEACSREAQEEAGITVDSAQIELFHAEADRVGYLLLFGLAPITPAHALPVFTPTSEASEIAILHEPTTLAFPLHTQALARYLGSIKKG